MNIVQLPRQPTVSFRSRRQLHEVSGIGPKTFEQAAGFLRIREGEQPLDSTAVHPGVLCALVEQIASSLNTSIDDLIKRPQLLTGVKARIVWARARTRLADILEELKKPGSRSTRETFVAPTFNEAVREITDVQPGMVMEGVVTNVTKFGAFIDIGVHQDGLVHISEISHKFLKDPAEALKAGQLVKAKVLSADARTKAHLAVHQSALEPAPGEVEALNKSGNAKPQREAEPASMADKLSALNNKWRSTGR